MKLTRLRVLLENVVSHKSYNTHRTFPGTTVHKQKTRLLRNRQLTSNLEEYWSNQFIHSIKTTA